MSQTDKTYLERKDKIVFLPVLAPFSTEIVQSFSKVGAFFCVQDY